MEVERNLQYVSLMSPGFSGSTLLSMLLCSQPRCIGFGDTYFGRQSDPRNLCTCGVPFIECPPRCDAQREIRDGGLLDFTWGTATAVPVPRWLAVGARKYWPLTRSVSLHAVRLIPVPVRRRLFNRYYRENRLMLRGLARSGKYDIYFDGCKDPVRLELLRTEIANLKIIHMIRHPGAYVYHFYRLGERDHVRKLAQWARYHRRIRSFLELVGAENYRAITYEHVVGQPGAFLNEMAGYLGLAEVYDESPVMLHRSAIHIQGNRMRKTADRVLNLANAWRSKLPTELESLANRTLASLPWAETLLANTASQNTDNQVP